MDNNVILIDTQKKLDLAYNEWKRSNILGVDIECENNLHHYGASISIIQISSSEKDWIVDVLALENIDQVVEIFEDAKIEKVFHGPDFDFRMLYSEFNCRPRNIFDTQIAAQLLGIEEIGLGSLLEKFLSVNKIEKFQMADWTKRPLTPDMLKYATKDSKYLIILRNILREKLEKKNRLDWAEQEYEYFEKSELEMHDPGFWNLKGLRNFTDSQRAVLKELYDIREYLAKKVDRPVHFIINSKKMKQFSVNPPSFNEWKNMRGVHPIVRRYASEFYNAVKSAKNKKLPMPKKTTKRFSKEQKDFLTKLNKIRNNAAEKLGIESFLIMNKDQMKSIVINNSLKDLRDWQKELVSPHLKIN